MSEKSIKELIQAGEFLGKATDVKNELYQSAPGLSASGLVKFSECPAIFKHGRDKDAKETAAQRIGTLVHMRLLEPLRFEREVVAIEGSRNAKATKELIAEAEFCGKYVCNPKEFETAQAVAKAVLKKEWANMLLTSGEAEVSYFAKHPEFGFLMKCRPDRIHENKRIIVDVKTFGSLNNKLVEKQIRSMKYDWKAAFYQEVVGYATGTKTDEWKFCHLFVSLDEPYESRCLALLPGVIEHAQSQFFHLYPQYAECVQTDTWPGYPDDIEDFSMFI